MTSRPRVCYDDLVRFDRGKMGASNRLIAGVDEAGRGALAGPVVAAAVICEPYEDLSRIKDSKLLSEPVRERLYELIAKRSLAWGVGIVEAVKIDRTNILRATLDAMKMAVDDLSISPSLILVDGNHVPSVGIPAEAIVRGDRKSFSIAAASIMAKVTRDRLMRELAGEFPVYGFKRNKGYGTKEHIEAIGKRGMTSFHRRSFKIKAEV